MSASSSALVSWSRLVRYIPQGGDDSQIRYGEPVLDSDLDDVGSLGSSGKLKVKVLEGAHILHLKDTGRTEVVGRLLGPLTEQDVPIIRCIGLNYKTHSQFSYCPPKRDRNINH